MSMPPSAWALKVRQGLLMAFWVLVFLLVAPNLVIRGFLFAVVGFCAWEWSRVVGLRAPLQRGSYTLLVVLVSVRVAMVARDTALSGLLVHGLAAAWLLPLGLVVAVERSPRRTPPGRELPFRIPSYVVGLAGFFVLAPFAFLYDQLVKNVSFGHVWLLLSIAMVATVDALGQIVGRKGKRRLVPRTSPKKTWEGFLAGVAGAALLGCIASFWNRLDPFEGALLGALVGAASVIGDLTASLAKRNVPVKDFSALLGQHGGVMDRFDGHLAAAPVLVAFLHVVGVFH